MKTENLLKLLLVACGLGCSAAAVAVSTAATFRAAPPASAVKNRTFRESPRALTACATPPFRAVTAAAVPATILSR